MTDVLVGVDESPGAAAALRWAVDEARAHGWHVTAVLAWGLLDQHYMPPDERFDPSYGEGDAVAALAAAVEQAIGAEAAATVDLRVVCDLPARALIEGSAGARLLVVGARGLGGFSRLLLGSVSDQCLHHATSPVAVVRAGEAPSGDAAAAPGAGRVVVGVDGSEEADLALRWAIDEGRARGAAVEAVHAWQPTPVAGYPFAPASVDVEAVEKASRQLLDRAVDAADTAGLERPVTRTLVCASAVAAILDAAAGADLVVVGARGVGGFRGLVLGSVSQQVTRHAPCPVIVVRPER